MSETAILQNHETELDNELMESKLEVVGSLLNPEEILEVGLSDIASVTAALDRDGNVLAARATEINMTFNGLAAERRGQVLSALGPLMQIAANYVRSHVLDDDVVQVNIERPLDRVVEDRPLKESDNRIPHVDGARNSFGVAIGTPTIVWEGKFNSDPSDLAEIQKDAYEQFNPKEFTKAEGLKSGDIFKLSGPVIHQSPEANPETWGERRVFITVYATPNSQINAFKVWDDKLGQPVDSSA